jgi:hypothetical protein
MQTLEDLRHDGMTADISLDIAHCVDRPLSELH